MKRIIKGDTVIVNAGKYRGVVGVVLRVVASKSRGEGCSSTKMIVAGVNQRVKHEKPSANSAGGLVKKESLIDSSNLSLLCKFTNKGSKVGYKYLEGGEKKTRFYKRSKECLE